MSRITFPLLRGSREGQVDTVTRLRAGETGKRTWIAAGTRDFVFTEVHRPVMWSIQIPIQWVPDIHIFSSSEVTSERNYTSTPPYTFVAWCLINTGTTYWPQNAGFLLSLNQSCQNLICTWQSVHSPLSVHFHIITFILSWGMHSQRIRLDQRPSSYYFVCLETCGSSGRPERGNPLTTNLHPPSGIVDSLPVPSLSASRSLNSLTPPPTITEPHWPLYYK